ncbi:hypothetical protein V8E52_005187, partial [Russula decolorans]
PVAVDEEGLLLDVDVQLADKDPPTHEDKRRDVDQFFHTLVEKEIGGKKRKQCTCKLCPIVDEVTTLRHHLEAHHSVSYRNWAKTVNFTSKLPGDIKKCKEAAELATRTLDQDLVEKKSLAHVTPYSDKLFCQASVEWLVATDQPIQALQHPKFQKMINVASRTTKYMTIPGRKATRAKIMHMFKDHLCGLKARLNGQTVTGEISLTCDAWQASNTVLKRS